MGCFGREGDDRGLRVYGGGVVLCVGGSTSDLGRMGRPEREEQKWFCLKMPSGPGICRSPHPGKQGAVCLFTTKVRVKLSTKSPKRRGSWSLGQESICRLQRGVLGSSPKAVA